jgi:hypothetical protein
VKRIAIVASSYGALSDAQHIGDRFLVGYPRDGAWHKPDMKVVSLYVDQPASSTGDQSAARAKEFAFEVYPTVAQALRVGGSTLAVDAVVVVGDFARQCIEVFDADRAAVPLFSFQQVSAGFDNARAVVDASRRLKFPLLAGSALSVTRRLPDLDLPLNADIESALVVGYGETDAMTFQALDALQCMVERRRGGETGVASVQMLEGDAVWAAGDAGRYSKDLLVSALSRSDSPLGPTIVDGRTRDLVGRGDLPKLVKNPAAYFIEYRDGLKATCLMLTGGVKDFTFAARVGRGGVQSTQFFVAPPPNLTHTECLARKIEELFETGKAPYPVERALLAAGILESGLASKADGQTLRRTPQLDIRYRAPQQSQHARM